AVISVHAWRLIPFAVVIFLAGLASIPAEVEDAAKIDGARGFRKFLHVTLPLQLPIATVALLFGIVFTATDLTVVYILTGGGPFNSTQMLTTWATCPSASARGRPRRRTTASSSTTRSTSRGCGTPRSSASWWS